MKAMKAEYESALDRLRADLAGQKVWLFALVFGAVVTGVTLGLALSVWLSPGSDPSIWRFHGESLKRSSDPHSGNALARRLAVLEERMKTMGERNTGLTLHGLRKTTRSAKFACCWQLPR